MFGVNRSTSNGDTSEVLLLGNGVGAKNCRDFKSILRRLPVALYIRNRVIFWLIEPPRELLGEAACNGVVVGLALLVDPNAFTSFER